MRLRLDNLFVVLVLVGITKSAIFGQSLAVSENGDYLLYFRDFGLHSGFYESSALGQKLLLPSTSNTLARITTSGPLGVQTSGNGILLGKRVRLTCREANQFTRFCEGYPRMDLILSREGQPMRFNQPPLASGVLPQHLDNGQFSPGGMYFVGSFLGGEPGENPRKLTRQGLFAVVGDELRLIQQIALDEALPGDSRVKGGAPEVPSAYVSSDGSFLTLSAFENLGAREHWLHFHPRSGAGWKLRLAQESKTIIPALSPDGKDVAYLINSVPAGTVESPENYFRHWRLVILDATTGTIREQRQLDFSRAVRFEWRGLAFSVGRKSVLASIAQDAVGSDEGAKSNTELYEFPLAHLGNGNPPRLLRSGYAEFSVSTETGSIFLLEKDQSVTRLDGFDSSAKIVIPPMPIRLLGNASTGYAGKMVALWLVANSSESSVMEPRLDPTEWSVTLDGETLPILYPGKSRFFVQLPWRPNTFGGNPSQLIVAGPHQFLSLHQFFFNPFGSLDASFFTEESTGLPIVYRSDFSARLVPGSQVRPGEVLVAAMTGLGSPSAPPPAGTQTPEAMPVPIPRIPSCNLGLFTDELQIAYVGLIPGEIGIYQVNIVLPASKSVGPKTLTCGRVGSLPLQFVE